MYAYQIKVPWVGGNVQLTHCQHSVFMQSRTSNPMQPIITCEWTLHRFSVNQPRLMWFYVHRLQWWRFKKSKQSKHPALCFKIKVWHLAAAQTSSQVDKANVCLPSPEGFRGSACQQLEVSILSSKSWWDSYPKEAPHVILLPWETYFHSHRNSASSGGPHRWSPALGR